MLHFCEYHTNIIKLLSKLCLVKLIESLHARLGLKVTVVHSCEKNIIKCLFLYT